MRNYLKSGCAVVCLVSLLFSCSNGEQDETFGSHLNQDISNKTDYLVREVEFDFMVWKNAASKISSAKPLFNKVDSLNTTLHSIFAIIDSHIEWVKNNEGASPESFYDEKHNDEIDQVQNLLEKFKQNFFQLVDSTYLKNSKASRHQNTVKYLQELLQPYGSKENSLVAFEMNSRLLKLNLYTAFEKLSDIVLSNFHGDGMVVNDIKGKVLFDLIPNKDSIQCNVMIHVRNKNIDPIFYMGKVDFKQFKDGENSRSIQLTKLPLIGNYKEMPVTNGIGQINISIKEFHEKEIEGVIEFPGGRNGSSYMPFKRSLNKK